ncbi:MAG: ROK family protein [Pseudonocardia sp.]|nr:ROK family protein [Pseudonocardia sp.]
MSGKNTKQRQFGFGVDVGGTGIKAAPVDLEKGKLAADRLRVPTPIPSTPEAVATTIRVLLDHFDWVDKFGCTLPSVVQQGIVRTAANIDQSWIGVDAHALLAEVTGRIAWVSNDADAAGVAEVRHGVARKHNGTVLVATLGTGIGSALLVGGRLVPNLELGHLELDGVDAETRAAYSARERENLSWVDWADRLTRYFRHVEDLLWPDLIVVGGGVSKEASEWLPLVRTRSPIVPAELRNNAGVVGAAVLAIENLENLGDLHAHDKHKTARKY